MIEPDYAFDFIGLTTQIITTILGFTIVFWIFWYQFIGSKLKLELGKRIKAYTVLYYYRKFENKFFDNFIHGRIPFTKKNYGYVLRVTKLGFLYVKIRNATKDKKYIYVRKIFNWNILVSYYVFGVVIMYGVSAIYQNVLLLFTITKFSKEQLIQEPNLYKIVNTANINFGGFLLIFSLYIFLILTYTIFEYKKNKQVEKEIPPKTP
jgi:hypothetical protein